MWGSGLLAEKVAIITDFPYFAVNDPYKSGKGE
jgi:hypothetical protein